MDIHELLQVVDRYEKANGRDRAILLSCAVMGLYIKAMASPLPSLAQAGLEVFLDCKDCSSKQMRVRDISAKIAYELAGKLIVTENTDPEVCILNAIRSLLMLYLEPQWGGGASEALLYLLDYSDGFESDHQRFATLLNECFGSVGGS